MKIPVQSANCQMMFSCTLLDTSVECSRYGFVACTSKRFHKVYLDTFGGETLTEIKRAAISPSLAALCLDMDRLHYNAIIMILVHFYFSKQ